MKTLKLKRKYTASYEFKDGNLTIKIVNPFKANGIGSDAWNIVIEHYNGNDDDYVYISEYFDTKKQASIFGANWLLDFQINFKTN